MCHGILVTDVDGVFAGINVMTGTFSLIVKGRKIENGRETDAFCQVTIAGNFFDMLGQIQGIANDYISYISGLRKCNCSISVCRRIGSIRNISM